MNRVGKHSLASLYSVPDYDDLVVNSALWAAAGDAIGWITELSRGPNTVRQRTGKQMVSEPIAWQRLIGGKFGVTVELPAGTYSDDTQLRLCVSRAILGRGTFDVEAFAKIELTVWQGYSLGAGIGSKAAAANLTKRGVNWFSNFFKTDKQKYTSAGGNGASMRIQPHVWSSNGTLEDMVLNVMRDSIVTHGHPHGFCGAIFHALCLWHTIEARALPSLELCREIVDYIRQLPRIIKNDDQLSSFWLPAWEREASTTFSSAIQSFCDEAMNDISGIRNRHANPTPRDYHSILDLTGCLKSKFRGSGFKTALAALVLANVYGAERIEEALAHSANETESDTDTIATMAGALLGSLVGKPPTWPIQDLQYISSEALRMSAIARGDTPHSFKYPDISSWEPPTNQSNTVVLLQNELHLLGLGPIQIASKEYKSKDSIWQWFYLRHGQTVLAKRRANLTLEDEHERAPAQNRKETPKHSDSQKTQQNQFDFDRKIIPDTSNNENSRKNENPPAFKDLDTASSEVINSGFDNETLGRLLNQCIMETNSIESAIAFAAIVAKARLARKKRSSQES